MFRPIGALSRFRWLRNSKVKYKSIFHQVWSLVSPSSLLEVPNVTETRDKRRRPIGPLGSYVDFTLVDRLMNGFHCFSTRTVFNILEKKNPFERLILESRCIDCSFDERLEYMWTLFLLTGDDKDEDSSWEEETNWKSYTKATGLEKSSLVVEAEYFLPGETYRLRLNAWRPGGFPGGYVIEEIIINIGPASGWCSVPQQEGYALETPFHVSCEGWTDPDVPLTYLIGKFI